MSELPPTSNPTPSPVDEYRVVAFLHTPISRNNAWLAIIFVLVAGVGMSAFYWLGTTSHTDSSSEMSVAPEEPAPPVESGPRVYSTEELQAAMDKPLPPEEVRVYDEEDIESAMAAPPSQEEVRVYTEEELKEAME